MQITTGLLKGSANVFAYCTAIMISLEGFFLELWGSLPDVFTISVRTPGGETIPSVRLGLQDVVTYSFVYEKSGRTAPQRE